MVAVAGSVIMLYLSITILQQKEGQDVYKLIQGISRVLVNTSDTTIIQKFKVTGEPRIVAVVKFSNLVGQERIERSLWKLGVLKITADPIITFGSFFRTTLGVPDELTRPGRSVLRRENLLLVDATFDYYGYTTEEFLSVLRAASLFTLMAIKSGEVSVDFYKVVTERRVISFFNAPDPVSFDAAITNTTIYRKNGANIQQRARGLQFLDDYLKLSDDKRLY